MAHRVLVTGCFGMIGMPLVEALCRRPDVEVVYGLDRKCADELNRTIRCSKFKPVYGQELAERPCFLHVRSSKEITLAYHLASTHPTDSTDPLEVNLNGLKRIEQWLGPGAHVVFTSSAAARCAPNSPYGQAKLQTEQHMLGGAYNRTILRLENVVGWSQNRSNSERTSLFESIVVALRNQSPIMVHGSGEEVRDYVGLATTVDALLQVGFASTTAVAPIVVGSGWPQSSLEFVRFVLEELKMPYYPVHKSVPREEPVKWEPPQTDELVTWGIGLTPPDLLIRQHALRQEVNLLLRKLL